MIGLRLGVISLLVSALASTGPKPVETIPRCEIQERLPLRSKGTSALLAVAMPDSVQAPPPAGAFFDRLGQPIPGTPPSIFGQRFKVLRVLVPDTTQRKPDSLGIVTVVPWDYTPSCARQIRYAGAMWASPGDTIVILTAVRNQATPPGGALIYDVTRGLGTYELAKDPFSQIRYNLPPHSNSSAEMFEMLLQMPTVEALQLGVIDTLSAFKEWGARHPVIFARTTAQALMAEMEAIVRKAGGK